MRKFLIATTVVTLLALKTMAQQVGWETGCETIDGWHANNDDAGFQTKVEQAETGVIKLTQDGADTWGKAAFVVENIDLDKTPILEVKVNKVDKGAGYKVMVAPRDWSELVEVIERSSADGVHKGNIKKAIAKDSKNAAAYGSPASFNIVVVVEGKGKSVWLDNLKIRAE